MKIGCAVDKGRYIMPNNCFNEIKVYGNRNELVKFKNSVADGDTDFSLDQIKPVPEDLIDFETWAIENWRINRWPLYANLKDNKDHLFYEVVTAYVPPVGIFSALFDKYPNYDFEIYCDGEAYEFTYELNFKNGKVDKNMQRYWEMKDCKFNKVVRLTWEEDYLNRTVQVVRTKMYEKGDVPQIPEDI